MQRLIITEEKCDGTVSLQNWSQLWPEPKEAKPLVINGFIDDITPAHRTEVPFKSIFRIWDRLDKHPEKAQQLSFTDSLMLLRDVYRVDLKKITMFGARTTLWTQIMMILSTRFFICLKNHCNHQQDCFTMRSLIGCDGITCWSSLDHHHLQIDHVMMFHSNIKV
jgi:hypothetical protein